MRNVDVDQRILEDFTEGPSFCRSHKEAESGILVSSTVTVGGLSSDALNSHEQVATVLNYNESNDISLKFTYCND